MVVDEPLLAGAPEGRRQTFLATRGRASAGGKTVTAQATVAVCRIVDRRCHRPGVLSFGFRLDGGAGPAVAEVTWNTHLVLRRRRGRGGGKREERSAISGATRKQLGHPCGAPHPVFSSDHAVALAKAGLVETAMPAKGRRHLRPARLADRARWEFPAQGRRACRPDLSQPHVKAGTRLGNRFTPMHRRFVHASSEWGQARRTIQEHLSFVKRKIHALEIFCSPRPCGKGSGSGCRDFARP